jgi:hypothetical protein
MRGRIHAKVLETISVLEFVPDVVREPILAARHGPELHLEADVAVQQKRI